MIALVAIFIAIVTLFGIYWVTAPKKIKTGRKMGDPTIIPELQEAADSLLNAELTLIDGLQGQVIVMEVETGEIKALVGLERNFEGKLQPCKNFGYQQELGSLTKTASLLAVLETGEMKLSDVVNTGDGVKVVDDSLNVIRDHNWRRGRYGMMTLERALEVSSNVGTGLAVNKAFGKNQQRYFDMLDNMSFGQPDSIDGIVGLKPTYYSSPKDKNWTPGMIWWSAIGYERQIAPIQMLTFYNAIANGGRMVKPTLKTGVVEIINPQIASKANIDSMRIALEHVVSRGLGLKAGTHMVSVAGKTGTSQVKVYEFGNETSINEYQMAFCGYFPANEPKYSIIVSLNKLEIPASGGRMAGVVFHDIVEWMVAHDLL